MFALRVMIAVPSASMNFRQPSFHHPSGPDMQIRSQTIRTPGSDLIIDCPACSRTGVTASSYEEEIHEKLYGLIPVNRVRRSRVECNECHAKLTSSILVAELAERPATEITTFLRHEAGFVEKSLALLAFILCITPLIGTILAGVALFVNRRYRYWPKTLSLVALVLSFFPYLFIAVMIYLEEAGRPR